MKIVIKTIYMFACYKVLQGPRVQTDFKSSAGAQGAPEGEGWSFPNILIMCTPHLGLRDQKAAAIRKLPERLPGSKY